MNRYPLFAIGVYLLTISEGTMCLMSGMTRNAEMPFVTNVNVLRRPVMNVDKISDQP